MKKVKRMLALITIFCLMLSVSTVYTKKGKPALAIQLSGLDRYICNVDDEPVKIYAHADENSEVLGVLPKYHGLKLIRKQDNSKFYKVAINDLEIDEDYQYIQKSSKILTGKKLEDYIQQHPTHFRVSFKSKGLTGAYSTLYDLQTDNRQYETFVEFREGKDCKFYKNPYDDKYVKDDYVMKTYVHPTADAVRLHKTPDDSEESAVALSTVSSSFEFVSESGQYYKITDENETYYISKSYAECIEVKEKISNICKREYKHTTLYPVEELTDSGYALVDLGETPVYVKQTDVDITFTAGEGSSAKMVNNNYQYIVAEVGENFIKVVEESEYRDSETYLYTDFDIKKNYLEVLFDGAAPVVVDEDTDEDSSDNPNPPLHHDQDTTPADTYSDIPNEVPTTEKRDAIVEYAMQWLGHPYVYGGTSIKTGIDCSAFQQFVMRHFDIDIGRSTAAQTSESKGKKVKAKDIKRGDLIYYTRDGRHPYHVVMYLGNGDCVHASCGALGVCIGQVKKDRILMIKNYID